MINPLWHSEYSRLFELTRRHIKPLAIRNIGNIKRKRNHFDCNNFIPSPLPCSYSLLLPHPFPKTDRGNMRIYVKMLATICANIRIYVCASDSA